MEDEIHSLPSNYVSFLQLKERWLQQQQSSSSHSTVKPKDDSASKTPTEAVLLRQVVIQLKPEVTIHDFASKTSNEAVPRETNHHRDINQLKPEVKLHDSASKIANEAVPPGRSRYRVVNQSKPEVTVHDSASKTLGQEKTDQSNSKVSTTKNSNRSRNPRFVTDQIPTGGSTTLSESEPVHEKKQHRLTDNYSVVEKQEHNSDQSNSKPSTKKNGFRGQNPRFVNGGSTLPLEQEPESEPVQETKQHNHPIVEKQEHSSEKFNSKVSSKKNSSRGRNPRFVAEQIPSGDSTLSLEPEPVQEKKQHNHSIVEKQEHSSDKFNSKVSTKKNGSRGRNPRLVAEQIPSGGSTISLEPEAVQEKKQYNHSVVEKQEHNSDKFNSKVSTKKNSSRGRNPRFVAEQVPSIGSTGPLEPELVQEKKQHNHPVVEKQEHSSDQSNFKKKNSSRGRNHRFFAEQVPSGSSTLALEPESEPVQEKKQHNPPVVEKQENSSDQSNFKKKNSSRGRNPRFVAEHIPTGDSTPEPEPMEENRNQEVWEVKGKTPNVDDLSHNDSVAAVKEISVTDVSQGTNRRWGSGRFQGSRRNFEPSFRVKKAQMTTTVWVKKGESAPN